MGAEIYDNRKRWTRKLHFENAKTLEELSTTYWGDSGKRYGPVADVPIDTPWLVILKVQGNYYIPGEAEEFKHLLAERMCGLYGVTVTKLESATMYCGKPFKKVKA